MNVANTGKLMILPRPKSSLTHGTSSFDILWKFNIAYLLNRTEETNDKLISNCDILSAAVLESIRSHMSTSDRLLSSGMTYFSCIFSQENFHHCIFGLFQEAMQQSPLQL